MDKVILMIGAGSDIGMNYLKRLDGAAGKENITVLAQYRKMSEDLKNLCEAVQNIEIRPYQADLSGAGETEAFIEKLKSEGYVPTHIIHLANAPYKFVKLKQWDEGAFREEMEIALYSLTKVSAAFLPAMAKAGFGRVAVLLSAVTMDEPPKFTAPYTTVKYAMLGFMKAAAAEYAGKNICINALSPDMMDTKFIGGLDEKIIALTAQNMPGGKLLDVDVTVDALEKILSEDVDFTGQNIPVKGKD